MSLCILCMTLGTYYAHLCTIIYSFLKKTPICILSLFIVPLSDLYLNLGEWFGTRKVLILGIKSHGFNHSLQYTQSQNLLHKYYDR